MKIEFDIHLLEAQLEKFKKRFIQWQAEIRDQAVIPPNLVELSEALTDHLLEKGKGINATLTEFETKILPGFANTAGPRSFPWVVGGVTPAALLGGMYQIAFDQINMTFGASIAPKLEAEIVNLLLDLFYLSRKEFTGTLTTGATASNLSALAAARQWCGAQVGIDISKQGMRSIPAIKVYSASAHSSISKSMSILGMGRENLISVPKLAHREAMDPVKLAEILHKEGNAPKIVVASAGTVNSGDFDELAIIAEICRQHKVWLHVDAAFGLFAHLNHRHKELVKGVEMADSITCDGHKWLNVPYDCGILFINQQHNQHLIASFSNVADYLKGADAPMNKGVENSRALRALPVWMTLTAYGREGYQELIEQNCAFAETVAEFIQQSDDYELLAPVRLNIVLFRAKNCMTIEANDELVSCINATGKIFMTNTVYEGQPALRIAVCNWRTCIEEDLSAVEQALTEGMAIYRKK